MSEWKARALAVFISILLGSNFVSIKIIQDALPPPIAMAVRFMIASAVSLPMLCISINTITFKFLLYSTWVGAWLSLAHIGLSQGLQTSQPSTAAFICACTVVVPPILDEISARVFGNVHIVYTWTGRVIMIISIAMALGGVAMLTIYNMKSMSTGDLWLMLQPIGFGVAAHSTAALIEKFPNNSASIVPIQVCIFSLNCACDGDKSNLIFSVSIRCILLLNMGNVF